MAALPDLRTRAKVDNDGVPLTDGNRTLLITHAAHRLLQQREDEQMVRTVYGGKPKSELKMVRRSPATRPGALITEFMTESMSERFERE